MTIVLVIDVYNELTNGTVVSARRFVEELRKRGHTVRIVSTEVKGLDCYSVAERKIPIASKVARKQKMLFGQPDREVLRKAMQGADIVHCYLPFKLEKVAMRMAHALKIPCLGSYHLVPESISYNCWFKKDPIFPKILYLSFKNKFFRYLTDIHCPSQFVANKLQKNGYKSNLHVISNGVASCFVPPIEPIIREDDYFHILSIGRYAAEKRQDILIKAIAKSKYADKIHLSLLGIGPMEKKLRKLADKYLKGPVQFAFCHKDALVQAMYYNDLYIHAADVESEAIACIEAISVGLVPIIAASNMSAASQFALDDRSLFQARNTDDLANKIDYWIENEAERKKMSKEYITFSEQFKLDKSITKMEILYREMIEKYRHN